MRTFRELHGWKRGREGRGRSRGVEEWGVGGPRRQYWHEKMYEQGKTSSSRTRDGSPVWVQVSFPGICLSRQTRQFEVLIEFKLLA
eukprot:698451-Hanusia_phi.AAC.2